MILSLCERFGCLPSALLAESADLLQLVAVTSHGVDHGDG